MIVNIGTGVAPVNIAFSSSRRAASIEHKNLQNSMKTIYKTPSFYIEQNKNPSFYNVRLLNVSQFIARIRDNT